MSMGEWTCPKCGRLLTGGHVCMRGGEVPNVVVTTPAPYASDDDTPLERAVLRFGQTASTMLDRLNDLERRVAELEGKVGE